MHQTNETPQNSPPRLRNRWSQERRLEFIDFRLRWESRINRSDLTDYFGISVPQASLDIARYLEIAPGNLEYDRKSRVYAATQAFKPVFPASNVQRYLNELLLRTTSSTDVEGNLLGWLPPVAAVPVPTRQLDGGVLTALLQAIRESYALSVEYQSMSRPTPTIRTLTPTAIAHDGFRWHVRAFCHTRNAFRDFVIARILKVAGTEPPGAKLEDDVEWHNMLQLVLGAHPDLSTAARRAIEFDYGMDDGQAVIECRQALLFYELRRLGLAPGHASRPEAQQIVLRNADALRPYINTSET